MQPLFLAGEKVGNSISLVINVTGTLLRIAKMYGGTGVLERYTLFSLVINGLGYRNGPSPEVAPLPLVNQLQRCHKAHPAVGVRISHRNGLSHGSNDGSRI